MRRIAPRLQDILDSTFAWQEAQSRLFDKRVPANEEAPSGDRGDNIGDDESPGRGVRGGSPGRPKA